MKHQKHARRLGFISIETIAILVVVVLVVVVAIAIIIVPDNAVVNKTPQPATQTTRTDPNDIGQAGSGSDEAIFVEKSSDNEITNPSDPSKPVNERLFDESNTKLPEGISPRVGSYRFSGQVLQVVSYDPLKLELRSYMNNSMNVTAVFEYPSSAKSKISYSGVAEGSLEKGQNLTIEEYFNLDLPYPDAIQSVKIIQQ